MKHADPGDRARGPALAPDRGSEAGPRRGKRAAGAVGPVARDSASAEFLDGTRRGVFLLRRHSGTGEYFDPSTVPAPSEEADLEYAPAAGGGRVVSWAVLHSRREGNETVRTVIGIVELDEGPWWWSRLVDMDPDADLSDLRVRVAFVPSGPEPHHEVVPVFRPAEEGSCHTGGHDEHR
ncbi:Zn-ribbon domain-containing OB-fold protein [Streptomyces chartreusis]